MSKEKCVYCRKDLSMKNPKFILNKLTMTGYEEFNFCCLNCLKNHINKK